MSEVLEGRVYAVTGASSGIGAAVAERLVADGARVAVAARRLDRLEGLVERLGSQNVVAVAGDVRESSASVRLVDAARHAFGRLDGFVANAGLGVYGGILDVTDEECAEMIDTNLTGTVWGVRAAVPALIEAGGGDIVLVASVAGLRGGGDEAVYAASKFGQVGLAGALDRELREKGIRVSAVCPAAVDTEFAIGAGRTAGDAWLKDVLRPADVADAVAYTLARPRHLRVTQTVMWAMSQGS